MSRPTAVNGILTNKNELDEINRRLKQNGIDPRIGDQAKLQELWHLFARTEADLLTSKQALSGAERQHAVEMQEVESYMEQVRHLSEERDALTQEFEMENDQLKKDVEKLRQEIADGKREVTQLLIQEGFMDLADGTPSEAIAYFLVERTRTMDELREAKRKAASSPGGAITTSKQVQEVLDKERKIMEEEMRTEREKVRKMKDSIEQDSKLKITSLESQKRRLEQEARHHHQKTRDLEFEMDRLKKSLEREKKERREEVEKLQQQLPGSPRDLNQSELSQLREAKKKLEMELSTTKYRLKTGEEDKNKLNQRVKELTESLDTEKKRRSSYEGTIIKLKSVVDRNKKLVTSLEDEKQTLSEEKSALQMRIGFLEKDLQELKEQEKSLRNQTTSLKSEQTIIERQESEIKSLREEKEQQALKLQRTMVSLETERRKCLELGEKLTSTEEKWEQIVQRYKNNEKDLANKLDKLTRDLDFSKSELEANHQRMHQIQQEHDKLENSVMKQSSLVEELSEEKKRNQKLQDQLNFSQETLKIAEQSTDHLKESIGRKSAELVKQYDWSKENQLKLENKVKSLQRELDEARSMTHQDKTAVSWRLEREEKRVKELEDMLTEKKEELVEARRESGRILMNQTRAEERAQEEARLRLDVEQRNKVLEEEMTKQWTQLKDLMARLTANESAKQELEVQLEKIPELQQQLDEKSLRLQATEAQLRDLTSTKIDLRTCKDDINRLKAQLHEERIDKSLLNQQLEDAKQQVAACIEREERLRHENSDMKHRLIETQNKLYATEDKSKSVEDMHSLAEQGKKSLRDQVSSLQQEVQRLQTELMQTSQRLDAQITKYEEHKLHHKNKIQQAREIFTRHKSVLADSLMKLQQDLNTTNAELQKEQNNRENLQKKHDSLLEEHRKLLALHSDAEEAVRDQNRNVSTMDYRVKYLERENGVLQDRIDTLSRQRVAMEKLIREYRLEKQKQPELHFNP